MAAYLETHEPPHCPTCCCGETPPFKDAARYRWLREHFRFANDSLRELWFDPAIETNDGGVPEDLDQEIDRAMSNAHSDR